MPPCRSQGSASSRSATAPARRDSRPCLIIHDDGTGAPIIGTKSVVTNHGFPVTAGDPGHDVFRRFGTLISLSYVTATVEHNSSANPDSSRLFLMDSELISDRDRN